MAGATNGGRPGAMTKKPGLMVASGHHGNSGKMTSGKMSSGTGAASTGMRMSGSHTKAKPVAPQKKGGPWSS